MSDADHNEDHLMKYFMTKTPTKRTIIFKISDVFDVGRDELTKEVRGKRRSMGMWLYLRLKGGQTQIRGFDISIQNSTIPYRYRAVRGENEH